MFLIGEASLKKTDFSEASFKIKNVPNKAKILIVAETSNWNIITLFSVYLLSALISLCLE